LALIQFKPFNPVNIKEPNKNKICYRRGCDNVGIHKLQVMYIDKKGLFCDIHKKELEDCGLIVSFRKSDVNFSKSDENSISNVSQSMQGK
jgi:hypothetical protein